MGRALFSPRHGQDVALGLRKNRGQFILLVAINAFVGAMVGLERTVIPLLAEQDFGITSAAVTASFVGGFGLAKAVTNLLAGAVAERITRRRTLILGWAFGVPVPLLIIWAPAWEWIVFANVLLGINQGLAWSMTVNMKVDLVGPRRRGLALGFNETAGYMAVGVFAFLSGLIAEQWGARPEPFYLGVAVATVALALSALFVRDTTAHMQLEARQHSSVPVRPEALRRVFADATWRRRDLFGLSQAGFAINLNDAVAWAIFPLYFAAEGRSLDEIAVLAAVYPLTWGILQAPAGWASDHVGRRGLIVAGFLLQAVGTAAVLSSSTFGLLVLAAIVLGVGKALAYPTLLAAVSDAVAPARRASSLGVYRFWRDLGALGGAVLGGVLADVAGFAIAIATIALITLAAGLVVAVTTRDVRSVTETLEVRP